MFLGLVVFYQSKVFKAVAVRDRPINLAHTHLSPRMPAYIIRMTGPERARDGPVHIFFQTLSRNLQGRNAKNDCDFFFRITSLLSVVFQLFERIELLRRVSSRKVYGGIKFILLDRSYLNMDIL